VPRPVVSQAAEGALWRTDGSFQSIFMLKNVVEASPIAVTPVLYMADGTEYDLAPVNLDPAGVAVVNINSALQAAPSDILPHISAYGSAAIRFQWGWVNAVYGSIRTSDDVKSLIYLTHLNANATPIHNPATPLTPQVLEGPWWKQEPGVSGFLALTNTSLNNITANLQVFSPGGSSIVNQSVVLAPHNTNMIDLTAMWNQLPNSPAQGGVRVTYTGVSNAIVANGGLQDESNGYSHRLILESMITPTPTTTTASTPTSPASPVVKGSGLTPVPAPTQPQPITYDSAGMMVGVQDSNMQFPAATSFTPYAVLRNATNHVMVVQLTANYWNQSNAVDVPLAPVQLAPQDVQQVNLAGMMSQAGISSLNGLLNLRTTFTGFTGDLQEETGSLDQTMSYVFEVPPIREQWTQSKVATYWNTAADTDTMVTLWNYSNQDEDVVLTFFHQEGQYKLPIHLAAHASRTMSMAWLIKSGQPDANGNTIPTSIVQGSAKLSGPNGNKDPINVAMHIGVFNVRTGTCSCPCLPCDGCVDSWTDPTSMSLAYDGGLGEMNCMAQWADGSSDNIAYEAGLESEDTSIAHITDTYIIHGGDVGETGIEGWVYLNAEPDPGASEFASTNISCTGQAGCGTWEADYYCDVQVQPGISASSPSVVPLVTGGSTGPNSMTAMATGTPSGGTYSWATTSSNVTLTNTTSASVTVTAASASSTRGDTPITATYTLNSVSSSYTLNISVVTPTSLQVASDNTNPTGHTCTTSTTAPTCAQSTYPGTVNYTSYCRVRMYNAMDQLSPSQAITGYALDWEESYSPRTGACSQNFTLSTSGANTAQFTDTWFFCTTTCQAGGTCSVSSTQTITVNGFTMPTESVNWTCSGVTVTP
jgi:hypothetical protein